LRLELARILMRNERTRKGENEEEEISAIFLRKRGSDPPTVFLRFLSFFS